MIDWRYGCYRSRYLLAFGFGASLGNVLFGSWIWFHAILAVLNGLGWIVAEDERWRRIKMKLKVYDELL